jgi:hypothetical protein
LKGVRIIPASLEIALQWHEGEGTHFARRVWLLACHYQPFEWLPQEECGGARQKCTLLLDETVEAAARDWLASQPTGQVTPRQFRVQDALNNEILAALNIEQKKPLCERTTRRLLIQLGWRMTHIRKGVYMDGHEHKAVIKYRNEKFLL